MRTIEAADHAADPAVARADDSPSPWASGCGRRGSSSPMHALNMPGTTKDRGLAGWRDDWASEPVRRSVETSCSAAGTVSR